MINEEHLATITTAHLQTIPVGAAHECDGIPGNERKTGLQWMLRFPFDTIGGGRKLRDGDRKFRSPIDTLDVGFVWLCIQNDGPHGIMNCFTKQERLSVVVWRNRGDDKTDKVEPLLQSVGHEQKVPRFGAAMPDSSDKVER